MASSENLMYPETADLELISRAERVGENVVDPVCA